MAETSATTSPAETVVTTQPTTQTTAPAATDTSTTPQPQPEPKTQSEQPTLLNTKPDETAKPEDKTGETQKPEGAPEQYADYTVPEGYTLDPEAAKGANEIFKKHNLSQSAAQEMIDYYFKQAIKNADQSRQSVEDMRNGWLGDIRNDPEFRSEFKADGTIKTDSKVLVGLGRMLDSLGDTKLANEFRQGLDITGAGNHPAIFKVIYRLSQHFSEGSAVRGNNPSAFGQPGANGQAGGQRPSMAKSMYPTLP